jgi:hypothetical protein
VGEGTAAGGCFTAGEGVDLAIEVGFEIVDLGAATFADEGFLTDLEWRPLGCTSFATALGGAVFLLMGFLTSIFLATGFLTTAFPGAFF